MKKAEFREFIEQYPKIKSHSDFTEQKLQELRETLAKELNFSEHKNDLTIVTTGSYGRGEASDESDIDLFIFFDKDADIFEIKSELDVIKKVVETYVPNQPGDTGTFGTDVVIQFAELINNIGGEKDTNQNMTRRVLLLLEGTWLFGEDGFKEKRNQLLNKYLRTEAVADEIPRFFLNDIIRFYRTMTTDFEYKVNARDKSWGLRSVKLRYSRKLLYFGGIVAVAASRGEASGEDRIHAIEEILDLPVLERICHLNGDETVTRPIFSNYETFLTTISDPTDRECLNSLQRDDRQNNPVYMKIRASSKEFSSELNEWLKKEYDEEHPIHMALIF